MTPTAHRRHCALRLAPVAMAVLVLALECQAGTRVVPGLDLRERYTDNVGLAREGQERSRFVTEIAPSLSIATQSPGLRLAARYQLHYFLFNDGDAPDTQRFTNRLSADGTARLVPQLLYLDGTAEVSEQSVSAFGPQPTDNPYADVNRTEVRSWRISPYLVHQFGGTARVQLRYAHDEADSNTPGFGDSTTDIAIFSIASGVNFRRFAWGANASRQVLDDSLTEESSISNANATLRWKVSDEWSVSATGGYDKYDYNSLGGATEGSYWLAGIAWEPSTRTSVAASVGERFFGRTYYLSASHRTRRTVWNLSYDEAVTTTRSQFFLPAAIDTAALLDRLFTEIYPDPVQRKLAVAAYMLATGLPKSLTDRVNYLSNRYMLQKQLMGTAMFRTARSSFVLGLYDVRRRALSIFEADSRLLGTQHATLNEHTRQRGLNGMWNWQVTSRSTVNLSVTSARTKSIRTGRTDDTHALRVSLSRQFAPRLRAAAEVRHARGSVIAGGDEYRENSVAASVSMQF